MKKRNIPLLFLTSLISCSQNYIILNSKIFCFDTMVGINLYEGDKNIISELENIFNNLDRLTDNYRSRDINNVYSVNHSDSNIKIDKNLYDLLIKARDISNQGATYFNYLCGSLSKNWKDAFKENKVLSAGEISEELNKISNTTLNFYDDYMVKLDGEAEIDLGGIAKGYSLDLAKSYLMDNNITKYLINAGSSSILLGEKNSDNGLFTVGINKFLHNKYLKVKNCFISTSGNYNQGIEIDGIRYSHIINPLTGSAISNYDEVIVISDIGYLGDAISTSMMMNTIDEIKDIETNYSVKTIVIKDNEIKYKNPNIEVVTL